eukprot:3813869-Prymnesium_polylepis.1
MPCARRARNRLSIACIGEVTTGCSSVIPRNSSGLAPCEASQACEGVSGLQACSCFIHARSGVI